jgi:nitrogen-specific signal transduction histidine kinase
MEIGRDITSELAYEKRLQQAQKLEAIGTLAGGIAHDFNNILSGIFGYAELSLMKKDVDSETERYIREIIKASERARDLVSQILTFSRQTDVQLRPLQPKVVIKEALKLLRASIPATIEIESTISSDSVIMAEPTQIHQVIMNLFTNAAHAIGDRTGTIRLELEDFVVGEDYTRVHPNITEGNHVLIRVTDTGSGIAPEVLDQIFEPFFTTKAQGKGTGLGLSVVHGIVKQLGGIVTAYSEVGKGTVFNVIIPCMAADGLDLREGGLTLQRGTERIAVLDDEGAIATTTASILTNLGYKVTAFTESMEALKAILSDPDAFDLIITDYSMPEMTGLEMTMKLRESNIDIPVILTSGFFNKDIENAALAVGISDLIIKPVDTYHLTDAIRKAFQS